jgi:KUP system potassium uptake protein
LHNLNHKKVLHEHNVIPTIATADMPRVIRGGTGAHDRAVAPVQEGRVAIRVHGDAERAEGARHRPQAGMAFRHHVDVVFPVPPAAQACGQIGMPRWQDNLFIRLSKSASDATDFFQIPTGRVVEVGTQVTV